MAAATKAGREPGPRAAETKGGEAARAGRGEVERGEGGGELPATAASQRTF